MSRSSIREDQRRDRGAHGLIHSADGCNRVSLPSVLVLDGHLRATLGIVRSLGRLGIPMMVGSNVPLAMAGVSRYAARRFAYPPDEAGLEATHAVLIEQVRAWKPDVLMPVFEHGWKTILAFHDEYSRLTAVVSNPGRELFNLLHSKDHMAKYAERHGVPIPRTLRPQSRDEALAMADQLPYPVLLKPRQSTAGIGIRRANNPREFAETLARAPDVPVIQEHIEGEDLELTILCVHGEPIAGSAYETLRNFPLPYGPSIACRTIRDDAFMRTGTDFLIRLGYHGVAHLDFRRDRRDGQVKLLDFNPRLAGTNEVSLRSGVNFPLMLYRLALGEHVNPCFTYDVGLEFRWLLFKELQHLAQTPNKARTVRELLRWRHVATNVSFADPLPHLAEGFSLLRRSVGRWRSSSRRKGRTAEPA